MVLKICNDIAAQAYITLCLIIYTVFVQLSGTVALNILDSTDNIILQILLDSFMKRGLELIVCCLEVEVFLHALLFCHVSPEWLGFLK